MGLEIGSFIDDLNPVNPVGSTDPKSEGDNHLRLIKTCIQGSFPGLAGAAFRVASKSADYTILLNDNTTLIRCTVSLTLTMIAAATLGNGFICYVYNDSRGIATISPTGSETFNGERKMFVLPDQLVTVFCDGVNFFSLEDTSWFMNPIINSGFAIWQQNDGETATVTGTNSGRYGPDGWQLTVTGVSAKAVIIRTTAIPAVSVGTIKPAHSMNVTNKTAKASFVAGERMTYRHVISGDKFKDFAERPFTFSFWFQSSVTGTYNIGLRNKGADRSYSDWFVISSVATPEYKSFLIEPSPSAGTWDYSDGTGLIVDIVLGGSLTTPTVTRREWTAADVINATANVNFAESLDASARLAAPMISLGSRSELWRDHGISFELQRAKRYYERSFPIDYGSASSSSVPFHGLVLPTNIDAGSRIPVFAEFKVEKRANPVITLWGGLGIGVKNEVRVGVAASSATVSASDISRVYFSSLFNNSDSAWVDGQSVLYNWEADARL